MCAAVIDLSPTSILVSARNPTSSLKGGCAEIAIVPVALEFTDDPDAWSLILAFEPVSGLVPSFRVLPHPVDLDDAACTALDALGALHVPETAAVDIACGEFEPEALAAEIKRRSNRRSVSPDHGWADRRSLERAAREIGRQTRAVVAFEEASGWEGIYGAADSRLVLESVIDQVLYWYHRRPSSALGLKSPIERWAGRNGSLPVATRS